LSLHLPEVITCSMLRSATILLELSPAMEYYCTIVKYCVGSSKL